MCNACSAASAAAQNPDQFAESLLDTLNRAGLAMMISVGHRTGLFETMNGAGWVTSQELAERSGMTERYVREWLGAMATGLVVEIDGSGDADRFRFPDAHAAVLCSTGAAMSTTFQWISLLGSVETDIVESFKHGGGVPYERYDRFHEVMADESSLSVVAGLHEHVLPLIPEMARKLEDGIDVLDIGCGSGRALCELARRFPSSRFTGYDLCQPAVDAAAQHAAALGLTNITFEAHDVTGLSNVDTFDLVTAFDVIHDQRDPEGVLAAVRRVLRPGGRFLMQDLRCSSNVAENLDHPLCPFFYVISAMHCMTVSLAQGGRGLGAAWGEQLAVSMLGDAGFEDIDVHTLEHDIMNNWYVMRKPAPAAA